MELSGITGNMDITDFKNNKLNNKACNSQSPASKIVLAKKGSPSYMKQFDADNDGQITLEEFNEYCEKNGINDKDKIKLLQIMQLSNSNSKTVNANLKKDEKSDELDEQMVYAKKGDDKYNEEMDTNKNGVITYAEYIRYMQKCHNSDSDEEEYITESIAPEVEFTVVYEG